MWCSVCGERVDYFGERLLHVTGLYDHMAAIDGEATT